MWPQHLQSHSSRWRHADDVQCAFAYLWKFPQNSCQLVGFEHTVGCVCVDHMEWIQGPNSSETTPRAVYGVSGTMLTAS